MANLVFPDSSTARKVYPVLKVLPKATAREMADVLGMSARQAQRALMELKKKEWVRQERLGSCMPHGKRSSRWWLTPEALEEEGLTGKTWHEEGNRCRLLELLPMLEWFYQILGQIKNLGNLVDFLWTDGLSMDATARFERGWIALYWSGPQETEEEITGRMNRLIDDVGGRLNAPVSDWPCLLAWVVDDEWQQELVRRAAGASGLWHLVSIWRINNDGARSGVVEPNPDLGRGWLHQPVRVLGTGGWSWEARVVSSIWSQTNGHNIYQMLRVTQNFPGMTVEMGQLDLGEGNNGKSAERTLRALAQKGLVHWEKDGKVLRYHLSASGIEVVTRLDKATHGDYQGRALSDSWVTRPDRRIHEAGALDLLTCFMAAGLAVAPGWRASVYRARLTIKPDGVVWVNHGPYRPGWCLLEYELSARGRSRATDKLRSYAALRHLGITLLLVCFDDRAEKVFHEVGAELDVKMVTTTVKRLADHGPLGNFSCWTMYGEPVRIG